jgi:DNA-binding winged helix-turn-helix (wHTH) protein/tetratricopeptide (TPR) repeat protein
MPAAPTHAVAYRFGPFRLRLAGRVLERDGRRVQLTPKVIDTLFVLIEHAPEVVTKEALMSAVWPDVNVVESGLSRNISALRKALEEESGPEPLEYVENIPRRGYRFLAPITFEFAGPAGDEAAASPPAPATRGDEPQPAARAPRWPWFAAAALVVVLGGTLLTRPDRRRALPVEPNVRIGEHLLYKLSPAESKRAVDYFERAVAANPRSGAAQAGLSISLQRLSMLGVVSLPEIIAPAEQAARRAVAYDPESSVAHYALGSVVMLKDWDFAAAERSHLRSLELSPDSAQTRMSLAWLYSARGRLDRAQQVLEEALRLDPASPALGTVYCQLFYRQRDFHRAEAECRKVLDREPSYALAHYHLGLILGFLDQYDEAERAFRRSGLMPAVVEADLAWLQLRRGNRSPARALLDVRREQVRKGQVDASAKLLLATILDLRDEAFEAIETGIRVHAIEILNLGVEPRLDSLRSDPRFAPVLQRIHPGTP